MKRKVKIVVDRNRLFDAIEKAAEKQLSYEELADSFVKGMKKELREMLGCIGEATADRILGDMIPDDD